MDVQAVKAECTRRVIARREKPQFRKIYGSGGEGRIQLDSGREFQRPETLDEWVDDVLTRVPGRGEPLEALFVIMTAARQGESAAEAAVVAARNLEMADQWWVWDSLRRWSESAPVFAVSVMRKIVAAWRQAGYQQGPKPMADGQLAPLRAERTPYVPTYAAPGAPAENTGRRH